MTRPLEHDNDQLIGTLIKHLFDQAEILADLHDMLTSSRDNYFNEAVLQQLGHECSLKELESLAAKHSVGDLVRHLHNLERFGLIKDTKQTYQRTTLGEQALDSVRTLEREVGAERSKAMLDAALGQNSLRLFLNVFGHNPETHHAINEVIYSPLEIGRLSLFLPRTIEGLAAIDKLDDAGLITYHEDGSVRVNPRRASAFYHYLRRLYSHVLIGHTGIQGKETNHDADEATA